MMKRILLLLALIAVNMNLLFAQTLANGFYRVQNKTTGRYMKIRDNYGELNMKTTTPDLTALITLKTFTEASSDPGTVFYIQNVGDNQYNITAQGTDIYSVITYYIRLKQSSGNTWMAYQTKAGAATVYLTDAVWDEDEWDDYEYGNVLSSGSKSREWYIIPISAATDNYACVNPTVQAGGKYYAPYYASFAFNLVSEGMKAYYVDKVDNGSFHMVEIEGTIPAATPVIIECASLDRSKNRIQPTTSSPATLQNNLLNGAYFNIAESKKHTNRVAYDKNTMRMLGVTSTGELGFVTASISYIPENTSYLVVPTGSDATMDIMAEVVEPEEPVVPETPDTPDPETPDVTDPETPNTPDPETPDVTDPETPNVTDPEIPDVTDPETPDVTDPETPDVTDPETPDVTDPETPDVTDPETPDVTDPETPDVTDPETPDVTDPETPDVTDPETPDTPDPETPDVTDPETPDVTDPETPDVDNAVESVFVDVSKRNKIYTLKGVMLNVTDVSKLSKGVYILNGKKFIVR